MKKFAKIVLFLVMGCATPDAYKGYKVMYPTESQWLGVFSGTVSSDSTYGDDKVTLNFSVSGMDVALTPSEVKELEKGFWVNLFSRENLLDKVTGNIILELRSRYFKDEDMEEEVKDTAEAKRLVYEYVVRGQVEISYWLRVGDLRRFTCTFRGKDSTLRGYLNPQDDPSLVPEEKRAEIERNNRRLVLHTALSEALGFLQRDFLRNKADRKRAVPTASRE